MDKGAFGNSKQTKKYFMICGLDTDEDNELYVMVFSNTDAGTKCAVYKIMH